MVWKAGVFDEHGAQGTGSNETILFLHMFFITRSCFFDAFPTKMTTGSTGMAELPGTWFLVDGLCAARTFRRQILAFKLPTECEDTISS